MQGIWNCVIYLQVNMGYTDHMQQSSYQDLIDNNLKVTCKYSDTRYKLLTMKYNNVTLQNQENEVLSVLSVVKEVINGSTSYFGTLEI